MKKLYKKIPLFTVVMLFMTIGFLISCNNDDADVANGQVQLLSFGPSGNMHGETISFIGNNLDQVTSIKLPGVEVSSASFTSQTAERIELIIPKETSEGKVVLVSPQGEITSKTILSFEVPFTVSNITSGLRPGENLVITGDFLNWIESVVFTDGVEVTTFESASLNQLVVKVPFQAQTGPITIIGKGTKSYTFESEQDIVITLPMATNVAPQAIKHSDLLTITGTDLDLVESVIFPNNIEVAGLQSQSATQIVVQVPNSAVNGTIKLKAYSGVLVEVEQGISIILPVITSAMPTPVDIGADWTLTGTDLDLIKEVTIPGADLPVTVFISQSPTQIVLKVPLGSSNGVVKLKTINDFVIITTTNIEVVGAGSAPLKSVIFDDDLRNGFNNWSWNVTSTIIDTEFTEGTKALKVEYQSDGGLKLANSSLSTVGMSELVFSIYGGAGLGNGGKLSLMVNNKYGALDVQTVAGKWVEFAIPFSELTGKGVPDLNVEIREMALQNTSGYFIIDKVGLR